MKLKHVIIKYSTIYWGLLALLPAIILGICIFIYGVNTPYADEWETPGALFESYSEGNITFSDFFSQHNASRKLFPKLIFFGLAFFTQWDIRVEMFFTLFLAILIAIGLYQLIRKTVTKNNIKAFWISLFINMFVFSFIQFHNWLFGIQLSIFIPIVLLIGCFLISLSSIKPQWKIILCIILSLISTFSFSNGWLLWALVPFVLFFNLELSKNNYWKYLLSWVLAMVFTLSIFFYQYDFFPSSPDNKILDIPIVNYIFFQLAYLGNPLGMVNWTLATILSPIIGFILVSTYFYIVVRILNNGFIITNFKKINVWVVLGAFSFLSGVAAAFGRVSFGPLTGLAYRYTTFSVYLIISLIPLLIIFNNLKINKYKKNIIISWNIVSIIAITLFLGTSIYGYKQMKITHQQRLEGKECLAQIFSYPDIDCLTIKVFGAKSINDEYLETQKDKIKKLNEINYLHPPIPEF